MISRQFHLESRHALPIEIDCFILRVKCVQIFIYSFHPGFSAWLFVLFWTLNVRCHYFAHRFMLLNWFMAYVIRWWRLTVATVQTTIIVVVVVVVALYLIKFHWHSTVPTKHWQWLLKFNYISRSELSQVYNWSVCKKMVLGT